jgi:ribosomally synthesized peptide (two-chain TOMM family)
MSADIESVKIKLAALLSTDQNETSPVKNEKPIEGLATEFEWPVVWLQAIALSWTDAAFKEALLHDPRTAILKAFGFTLPPLMDLVVFDAKSAGWEPPAAVGSPSQWSLPRTVVVMPLPPAPANEKQQGVALAAYNATGQSSPFTCCC